MTAGVLRTALVAGGLATLGTLPAFLLSAQAVTVGAELGLSDADLGLAASCFFGVAAVVSLTGSRFLEQLPSRAVTMGAAATAAASCLGIAVAADSRGSLLALLAVGGLANALLQVTANLMLARSVPLNRRGMAYGIKQSSIPVAVTIGGVAVPTIGLVVGWRWTFAATAVGCLAVAVVALRRSAGRVAVPAPTGLRDLPPRAPMLLSAVATMLASAAAVSLGAYLPTWAQRTGLSATEAAVLLSVAGLVALAARLASGFAADRRGGRHMPVVTLHLVGGSVGLALLSVDEVGLVVLGALLGFGIGWSWPGVLLFALVRLGRDSPATASSAVQGGNFAGAALGPALFGQLVAGAGYATAWRAAALAMLAGGLLLLVARRMFLDDQRRRPPANA